MQKPLILISTLPWFFLGDSNKARKPLQDSWKNKTTHLHHTLILRDYNSVFKTEISCLISWFHHLVKAGLSFEEHQSDVFVVESNLKIWALKSPEREHCLIDTSKRKQSLGKSEVVHIVSQIGQIGRGFQSNAMVAGSLLREVCIRLKFLWLISYYREVLWIGRTRLEQCE